MENIIVYYHISTWGGRIILALTEKDYWDAAHALDDGLGENHDDIAISMGECGYCEDCTSTYELEDESEINTIIEDMSARGYDLRTNAEFSAFLEEGD